MRADTWGPVASLITLACCLGLAPIITALTAVGLGFLINDLILIPLLVLFLGLTLWQLHRDRSRHGASGPLAAAWPGSVLAVAGLWIAPAAAWIGIAALIAGALWNLLLVRRRKKQPATAEEV